VLFPGRRGRPPCFEAMLSLLATGRPEFARLVDSVAREIVSTRHRHDGSFISTPLLYPSGSTVVVKISEQAERYFVTDMGLGYQEADLMGAGNIYSRQARIIAGTAGVGFDSQAFFIVEATGDQLPSAVVTVANCSQEAVSMAAFRLAERRNVDETEKLYERLVGVFTRPRVTKDAEIAGASTTKWPVTALVKPETGRMTVFEPVRNHHVSITNASAKFHDLKELEQPPNRIAVVHRKSEFGTWLGVLTQAASVIDGDVPDEIYIQLARAA
jgi:hypothetical protein